MDLKIIKDIIHEALRSRYGLTPWQRFITEDATPFVFNAVDVEDNSSGFLEVRYAATMNDSGIIALNGIKRVPFTREGGDIALGSATDEYLNAGSGAMAASEITVAAVGGTIEISATGADGQVAWEVTTFLNSAPAPEILT